MAKNSIPKTAPEDPPLNREEGFALLESLHGCMEGMFMEEGGASEFYRKEREAWNDASDERDRQIEEAWTRSAAFGERKAEQTP